MPRLREPCGVRFASAAGLVYAGSLVDNAVAWVGSVSTQLEGAAYGTIANAVTYVAAVGNAFLAYAGSLAAGFTSFADSVTAANPSPPDSQPAAGQTASQQGDPAEIPTEDQQNTGSGETTESSGTRLFGQTWVWPRDSTASWGIGDNARNYAGAMGQAAVGTFTGAVAGFDTGVFAGTIAGSFAGPEGTMAGFIGGGGAGMMWGGFAGLFAAAAEEDIRRTLVRASFDGAGAGLFSGLLEGTGAASSFRGRPPISYPKPPGWNSNWRWGPGNRSQDQEWRWWDEAGGEWRWHPPDRHHPIGHWDYNPWTHPADGWRNIVP